MKAIIILFLMPFLAYGQFVSVCDRTPQVRDAIMEKAAVIDSEIKCNDDDLLELILPEIKRLSVSFKRVTSLKSGDFSGLSSLENLNFNYNKITSLPPDIFVELSSLKVLWLADNGLTSLPPDIFSGLSSLETLYLGDNKITSLPPDVFNNVPSLDFLSLRNNRLTNVPRGIFDGLPSLTVTFQGNPLTQKTLLELKYNNVDFMF